MPIPDETLSVSEKQLKEVAANALRIAGRAVSAAHPLMIDRGPLVGPIAAALITLAFGDQGEDIKAILMSPPEE